MMCGAALLFCFSGICAVLAAAPAAGCLTGLYPNYGTMPRYYNG